MRSSLEFHFAFPQPPCLSWPSTQQKKKTHLCCRVRLKAGSGGVVSGSPLHRHGCRSSRSAPAANPPPHLTDQRQEDKTQQKRRRKEIPARHVRRVCTHVTAVAWRVQAGSPLCPQARQVRDTFRLTHLGYSTCFPPSTPPQSGTAKTIPQKEKDTDLDPANPGTAL